MTIERLSVGQAYKPEPETINDNVLDCACVAGPSIAPSASAGTVYAARTGRDDYVRSEPDQDPCIRGPFYQGS